MEAEIREILTTAVSEPAPRVDLFTTLLDRFGALGGIELPLPRRPSPARCGLLLLIVLDRNVVSELMRPSPAAHVVAWLRRQEGGSLATTAITVAEVRFGLARLPAGRRATQLQRLADDVLSSDLELGQGRSPSAQPGVFAPVGPSDFSRASAAQPGPLGRIGR